jgi:hypothetical protein|tara:strand:+ start:211 stop:708 length:498 start_codon:yes stop_codon:yes gene_type:complete
MERVTQKSKIMSHLQSGQSITPIDALERYGCFRLAAIIHTLKNDYGMNIKTELIKNKYGTKYGKYTMVNNPVYNSVMSEDEDKVNLLLKIYGYESVEFKNSIDNECRYIRIAYWKPISYQDLEQIHIHSNLQLEEVRFYEDECGYLYQYNIKQKQVNGGNTNESV